MKIKIVMSADLSSEKSEWTRTFEGNYMRIGDIITTILKMYGDIDFCTSTCDVLHQIMEAANEYAKMEDMRIGCVPQRLEITIKEDR